MELNIIVAMDILFLLLTVLNIEIVDSSVQMVSLNLFQISLCISVPLKWDELNN